MIAPSNIIIVANLSGINYYFSVYSLGKIW